MWTTQNFSYKKKYQYKTIVAYIYNPKRSPYQLNKLLNVHTFLLHTAQYAYVEKKISCLPGLDCIASIKRPIQSR